MMEEFRPDMKILAMCSQLPGFDHSYMYVNGWVIAEQHAQNF